MECARLHPQVSYAIGVAQPLSVHVDTYGTGTIPDKEILEAVLKNFDFRPGAPQLQTFAHITPEHARFVATSRSLGLDFTLHSAIRSTRKLQHPL